METLPSRPGRRKCGCEIVIGKLGFIIIVSSLLTGVISTEQNALTIVPFNKDRVYQRALGKSSVFTCNANVDDPQKLGEFQWWWPNGDRIDTTENRAEIMRDKTGTSLTLLFTSIQEQDLGIYRCTAVYDNGERLSTEFTLRAYVPITFEDAPASQYAVKGQDYKVKCEVRADPEPTVDWKKDHRVVMNNERLEMEKDGLLIRQVTESDEGVYTCRVRVTSMGTVEERHIQLEVLQPPTLISVEAQEVEVLEGESVTFHCSAVGKPEPEYEWANHRHHQILMLVERHTVDRYKGTLTIDNVKKEDAGVYTCTARNNAGHVTMKSTLKVVTKPVIEEFKNITTRVNGNAMLICRASGDPAPDIKFQKENSPLPFNMGPQKDPRIFMDQRKDGRNTVATLRISDVLRTDDGLYSCLASNQRIESERLGHLTVEFPPTFVNSPMIEAWTWDSRPTNLTCLAESIPNATISWFIEGVPEIPVDPLNENLKQFGSNGQSSLEITPVDHSMYGFYKCVAINKIGTAEHRVHLREAHKPGPVLEAYSIEKTATSITFKIGGPMDDGGLPVKNYWAQNKEDRLSWDDHNLKSWGVNQEVFTIDGLEPMKIYHVRFGAENEVSLGNWGFEKEEATPGKSAPDVPVILNKVGEDGVAGTVYSEKFELIWKCPENNGERIEEFEISYQGVRNGSGGEWEGVGRRYEQVKGGYEEPKYTLRGLVGGSFYKVGLRARNKIGVSGTAEIVIRTAVVASGSFDLMKSETTITSTADTLPMMIILFALTASIVVLLLIDVTCYRVNKTGVIWLVSTRMSCNKKKSTESLVKDATTIHEKRPLNQDDHDHSTCVTIDESPISASESTASSSNGSNGSTQNINITHNPNSHPKNSDV